MPIRKENLARYPKNWKAISQRIRFDRAAGQCECDGRFGLIHENGRCAARHGAEHPRTGAKSVCLTTAHLADPIENCSDENLMAMCEQCHNRFDAPMRAAGVKARREFERRRLLNEAGQISMEGMGDA